MMTLMMSMYRPVLTDRLWCVDPWGKTKDPNKYPNTTKARTIPGARPVTEHSPVGDSPYGVGDLVGNVWQWTDEFVDDHTARAVLRGGSNYLAGKGWYFPQALELDKLNTYLLMDDTYDRVGTVGFRCVMDAA